MIRATLRRLPAQVGLSVAILASATLIGGCAEERPIIDRVQPNALTKSIQKALDLLICLADKISNGFTGSLTYERAGASAYKAAGVIPIPVSYKMTCTMSFGAGGMDPALARELTKLKQKLTALLDLFHLQAITFNQLGKTVLAFKGLEITKSTAAGLMIEQLREEILKKLQALLSC